MTIRNGIETVSLRLEGVRKFSFDQIAGQSPGRRALYQLARKEEVFEQAKGLGRKAEISYLITPYRLGS